MSDCCHAETPSAGASAQGRPAAWIAGFVFVAGAVLGFGLADWNWRRPLAPSGGVWFARETKIEVPHFRQADYRWALDRLGPTDGTLGAEGCAVASAAMVLAAYGADTDPGRLNARLKEIEGFTPRGWLYWEKAAEAVGGGVRHVYEDLPSYRLIDENLRAGNPVIVRVRLASGVTHFVVVAGKREFDYLVRDPGAREPGVWRRLDEFGSMVEALRFYRKD